MQELRTVKTHEHNILDKMCVFDKHQCHMDAKFGVFVEGGYFNLHT